MNYQEADALLQGRCRESRKLENNTYLKREGHLGPTRYGSIHVRLHHTNIVTLYSNGRVTATAGGWDTVTTRNRLNSYMPGPYRVATGGNKYGPSPILYESGWNELAPFVGIRPTCPTANGLDLDLWERMIVELKSTCVPDKRAKGG